MSSRGRTLVAGVGDVFLGDDGFGVAVARRLAEVELPADVEVADFWIRGVHLARHMVSRIVLGALAAGTLVALIWGSPDIARDAKIRSM